LRDLIQNRESARQAQIICAIAVGAPAGMMEMRAVLNLKAIAGTDGAIAVVPGTAHGLKRALRSAGLSQEFGCGG
jgi:hypothetical protein